MVVTEAMASGLPCVVGKRIGAAEMIEDGQDGFLCDPLDSDTVVAPLRQLAATQDLAHRIGSAARTKVGRYSWDACAEATAQVYERILRDKAGFQAP